MPAQRYCQSEKIYLFLLTRCLRHISKYFFMVTAFHRLSSFIQKVTKEPILFYLVLFVNIFMAFTVKFFPSLDGPAHLYNSNVLLDLLKGSKSLLGEYYNINTIIIPNWLSHFILAFFGIWLPAWLSEKFFLVLYLFGLAFSFRLLIKQLSPQNIGLSVLIFPFAYTHLFCIGFYNYSFSFIFLFLTLYYWIKTQNKKKFKQYLILSLLITLTYFSGVLTYGFLGLILGLLIIYRWIRNYLETRIFKSAILGVLSDLLKLLSISVPSLIMLFLFYRKTYFPPPGDSYPIKELWNWLNDGRELITYAFQSEVFYTRQLIHIILIIISLDLYQRYLSKKSGSETLWSRPGDFLIAPILLALILFLCVPDDSGARMMSHRFNVLFFILLITWVASSKIKKIAGKVIVLLIIVLHFSTLFTHYHVISESVTKHAKAINVAARVIKPGSVVLPVNLSDNWLENHFSNYLGVDKPMVILENYEAEIGWFPVIYDMKLLPKFQLGQQNSIIGLRWIQNDGSSVEKIIDYVFIYGCLAILKDSKWEDLRKTLLSDYHLIKTSDEKYYMIYEKN